MIRTKLKSTTNLGLQYLIGVEGTLSYEANGRFHFRFMDGSGQEKDLSSSVVRRLGDLENPNSKEVAFQTKNSLYVFEKNELKKVGLYSYMQDESFVPAQARPVMVKLKSTSNINLQPYIGKEGFLSLGLDG